MRQEAAAALSLILIIGLHTRWLIITGAAIRSYLSTHLTDLASNPSTFMLTGISGICGLSLITWPFPQVRWQNCRDQHRCPLTGENWNAVRMTKQYAAPSCSLSLTRAFFADSTLECQSQDECLLAVILKEGLPGARWRPGDPFSLARRSSGISKAAYTVSTLWSDLPEYNSKCHPVHFFQVLSCHLLLDLRQSDQFPACHLPVHFCGGDSRSPGSRSRNS